MARVQWLDAGIKSKISPSGQLAWDNCIFDIENKFKAYEQLDISSFRSYILSTLQGGFFRWKKLKL